MVWIFIKPSHNEISTNKDLISKLSQIFPQNWFTFSLKPSLNQTITGFEAGFKAWLKFGFWTKYRCKQGIWDQDVVIVLLSWPISFIILVVAILDWRTRLNWLDWLQTEIFLLIDVKLMVYQNVTGDKLLIQCFLTKYQTRILVLNPDWKLVWQNQTCYLVQFRNAILIIGFNLGIIWFQVYSIYVHITSLLLIYKVRTLLELGVSPVTLRRCLTLVRVGKS